MDFFGFIGGNWERILTELGRHLFIVVLSLPISIILGVTIGILISRNKQVARIVIYFASILMTIPSLALFGFAVLLLAPLNAGIGIPPTVMALVVYSLLPIIRNTLVAIKSVDPAMVEAARGMGMTNSQILRKIRLPLAIPIIMAGLRNAAVMGVSVTTVAYLIGARGLGYFIFSGLSRSRVDMVLIGAIVVAALGIGTNYALLKLEDLITPRGLQVSREQK